MSGSPCKHLCMYMTGRGSLNNACHPGLPRASISIILFMQAAHMRGTRQASVHAQAGKTSKVTCRQRMHAAGHADLQCRARKLSAGAQADQRRSKQIKNWPYDDDDGPRWPPANLANHSFDGARSGSPQLAPLFQARGRGGPYRGTRWNASTNLSARALRYIIIMAGHRFHQFSTFRPPLATSRGTWYHATHFCVLNVFAELNRRGKKPCRATVASVGRRLSDGWPAQEEEVYNL